MQLFSDGDTGFYYDISGARKNLLAFKLGITEEKLLKVLDWCFVCDLLDKDMYDKHKILTSYKMQDDYSKIIERRAQKINLDYVFQADFTKKYENANRTTLEEAIEYYNENEPKGEFVLVIEGRDIKELEQEQKQKWEDMSLEEHFELYKDLNKKEAYKMIAKDRGISKRDVYAYFEK